MTPGEKLSDLPPNEQDEIVANRKAKTKLIQRASMQGNWFAAQAEVLDGLAKQHGINVEYSEELDGDDV